MIIAVAGAVGVLAALGAAYGRRHKRHVIVWCSAIAQITTIATAFVLQGNAFRIAGVVGVGLFVVTYIASDIRARPDDASPGP